MIVPEMILDFRISYYHICLSSGFGLWVLEFFSPNPGKLYFSIWPGFYQGDASVDADGDFFDVLLFPRDMNPETGWQDWRPTGLTIPGFPDSMNSNES
jgi:hypothetical protein